MLLLSSVSGEVTRSASVSPAETDTEDSPVSMPLITRVTGAPLALDALAESDPVKPARLTASDVTVSETSAEVSWNENASGSRSAGVETVQVAESEPTVSVALTKARASSEDVN